MSVFSAKNSLHLSSIQNDSTLSDSELLAIRGRLNEAIQRNRETYKITVCLEAPGFKTCLKLQFVCNIFFEMSFGSSCQNPRALICCCIVSVAMSLDLKLSLKHSMITNYFNDITLASSQTPTI